MTAIFLPFAAAIAACTPSAQESAMHSSSTGPGSTAEGSNEARSTAEEQAAVGPVPEPVSAAENPAPGAPADSPAEAQGRRTLSTAFVQVGPDGYLTVGLRSGRVLVLRHVIMRPKDYCGVQVPGGKYCGGYAEVAVAKPGGGPVPVQPDLAGPNPLQTPDGPTKPD
jgi:hypothetical protein